MHAADGAGLAAPQIAVAARWSSSASAKPTLPGRGRYPYTELVNPVLTSARRRRRRTDWEGCLSVPGLRGKVPRYRRLRYDGFDPSGTADRREVEASTPASCSTSATTLHGILYPMRMHDFSRFGFTDVLFPEAATPED